MPASRCSLVALLVVGAAAQTLNPGGYINGDPSRGSVENDAFTAPLQSGGFRGGRGTFYDASPAIKQAYAARGEGAFGDILYGSCGYFNQEDGASGPGYQDLPFPRDQVAAAANVNPDYPGTCGRCYQVRCVTGVVVSNGTVPVDIRDFYYLAGVNSTVKDTYGRSYPGNPLESVNQQFVRCWNATDNNGTTPSVTVHIVDNCPAVQEKPEGLVPQTWCNSDIAHLDLSYWAFEILAHPVYGVMPLEFQSVDCTSKTPLTPFTPGFVSKTIYSDLVLPGWNWQPYYIHSSQFALAGAGVDGSAATCINLATRAAYNASGPGGGGLGLQCRNCTDSVYPALPAPFSGANTLSFSIKSNSTGAGDQSEAASPKGQIPAVSVGLSNFGGSLYCDNNPQLQQLTPSSTATQADGSVYFNFSIPLSTFSCNSLTVAEVDTVGFQSLSSLDYAAFCLDNIVIA